MQWKCRRLRFGSPSEDGVKRGWGYLPLAACYSHIFVIPGAVLTQLASLERVWERRHCWVCVLWLSRVGSKKGQQTPALCWVQKRREEPGPGVADGAGTSLPSGNTKPSDLFFMSWCVTSPQLSLLGMNFGVFVEILPRWLFQMISRAVFGVELAGNTLFSAR